jgi:hypothetical protein
LSIVRRAAILVAALVAAAFAASTADAATPLLYSNCAHLNTKYPHGLGKLGARDKTRSGHPVTNFKRSTTLYLGAMRWNSGLDRDKDGIACEQA